jgi:hypothetical protein
MCCQRYKLKICGFGSKTLLVQPVTTVKTEFWFLSSVKSKRPDFAERIK